MLVLSRKLGERILIGDEIAVTLVRIGPNAVRLGIEAPRDLSIVREELIGQPIAGGDDASADATGNDDAVARAAS